MNVSPASVTASITAHNKTYDGTTAAVIADRTIAGILDTDDVVLLGDTATFDTKDTGVGKTVTASGLTLGGPDASNYTLATNTLTTTASITAAGVTANIIAANKVYDGTTVAKIIGRSLNGVIGVEDVTLVGDTAAFDSKGIGTGKTVTATGLTLGGADVGNYFLASSYAATTAQITRAILAANVTVSDKTYDATITATGLTRTLPGAFSNDDITVDGGAATFNTASAGMGKTVTVTGLGLSGADTANYLLVSSTVTTTGNILPATLAVRADNKTKAYGTANPALSASYTGFVAGQDASVISGSPGLSTTATDSSPTGNYPITVTTGSLNAANYTFNPVNGTLTVGQATLIVTANDASRAYGAADPVYTAAYSGFIGSDGTNLISGQPVFTTTADAHSHAYGSPYPISMTVGTLSASNYNFAFANGNLTITQAVVTIIADNQSKVYGAPIPALTFSGSGFANGETIYQLLGQPNLSTTASNHSSVTGGPYDIVISQGTLSSGDYTFTFVNGHLTVTQLGLNCRIQAGNKTYDGTTTAVITSRALSDPIGTDDVSLVGTNANFDTKNAGTDKAVTATNLSLGGADASNYYLISDTAATTANIAVARVSGNITVADKTYDGTATATITGRSLTGVIGSDDASLAGGAASFNNRLVGFGKTVTASGLALNGTDAGNYLLTSDSATNHAAINRATVTGQVTVSDKTYNGTTQATILTRSLLGVFNGDDVHLSGGGANFDTANAGTAKTVTATFLGLSGSDIGNYQLASSSVTTNANILPATLTVTADNKCKTEGCANPAWTDKCSGFVGSDNANVLSGTPNFNTPATVGSAVGTYPINISAGSLTASNYTFNFVNGTLTVIQPTTMSGNSLTVSFAGNPGQTYYIQASTNMTSWDTIATNVADQLGGVTYTDTTTTNYPCRYYRTMTSQ